jgi:hypothetical protein
VTATSAAPKAVDPSPSLSRNRTFQKKQVDSALLCALRRGHCRGQSVPLQLIGTCDLGGGACVFSIGIAGQALASSHSPPANHCPLADISVHWPNGQPPESSQLVQISLLRSCLRASTPKGICGRQQPFKGRSLFKQTFFNQFSLSIGQISLEQFTAAPNVVPHGSDLTQAVIDRSHRGRQRDSKLTLKADQPCNSSASRRSMKLRSMSVRWVFKSLRYRRTFASRVHRE